MVQIMSDCGDGSKDRAERASVDGKPEYPNATPNLNATTTGNIDLIEDEYDEYNADGSIPRNEEENNNVGDAEKESQTWNVGDPWVATSSFVQLDYNDEIDLDSSTPSSSRTRYKSGGSSSLRKRRCSSRSTRSLNTQSTTGFSVLSKRRKDTDSRSCTMDSEPPNTSRDRTLKEQNQNQVGSSEDPEAPSVPRPAVGVPYCYRCFKKFPTWMAWKKHAVMEHILTKNPFPIVEMNQVDPTVFGVHASFKEEEEEEGQMQPITSHHSSSEPPHGSLKLCIGIEKGSYVVKRNSAGEDSLPPRLEEPPPPPPPSINEDSNPPSTPLVMPTLSPCSQPVMRRLSLETERGQLMVPSDTDEEIAPPPYSPLSNTSPEPVEMEETPPPSPIGCPEAEAIEEMPPQPSPETESGEEMEEISPPPTPPPEPTSATKDTDKEELPPTSPTKVLEPSDPETNNLILSNPPETQDVNDLPSNDDKSESGNNDSETKVVSNLDAEYHITVSIEEELEHIVEAEGLYCPETFEDLVLVPSPDQSTPNDSEIPKCTSGAMTIDITTAVTGTRVQNTNGSRLQEESSHDLVPAFDAPGLTMSSVPSLVPDPSASLARTMPSDSNRDIEINNSHKDNDPDVEDSETCDSQRLYIAEDVTPRDIEQVEDSADVPSFKNKKSVNNNNEADLSKPILSPQTVTSKNAVTAPDYSRDGVDEVSNPSPATDPDKDYSESVVSPISSSSNQRQELEHTAQPPPPPEDDFQCHICSSKFSSDDELVHHYNQDHIRIARDTILEPESPCPPPQQRSGINPEEEEVIPQQDHRPAAIQPIPAPPPLTSRPLLIPPPGPRRLSAGNVVVPPPPEKIINAPLGSAQGQLQQIMLRREAFSRNPPPIHPRPMAAGFSSQSNPNSIIRQGQAQQQQRVPTPPSLHHQQQQHSSIRHVPPPPSQAQEGYPQGRLDNRFPRYRPPASLANPHSSEGNLVLSMSSPALHTVLTNGVRAEYSQQARRLQQNGQVQLEATRQGSAGMHHEQRTTFRQTIGMNQQVLNQMASRTSQGQHPHSILRPQQQERSPLPPYPPGLRHPMQRVISPMSMNRPGPLSAKRPGAPPTGEMSEIRSNKEPRTLPPPSAPTVSAAIGSVSSGGFNSVRLGNSVTLSVCSSNENIHRASSSPAMQGSPRPDSPQVRGVSVTRASPGIEPISPASSPSHSPIQFGQQASVIQRTPLSVPLRGTAQSSVPVHASAPTNSHVFAVPRQPASKSPLQGNHSLMVNSNAERPGRPPTVDLTDDEKALVCQSQQRMATQLHHRTLALQQTGFPRCELCTATFASAVKLAEHKTIHHPNQGIRQMMANGVVANAGLPSRLQSHLQSRSTALVSRPQVPESTPCRASSSATSGPISILRSNYQTLVQTRSQSPNRPGVPSPSNSDKAKSLFIPVFDMSRMNAEKLRKLEELGFCSLIPFYSGGVFSQLGIPLMDLKVSQTSSTDHVPYDALLPVGQLLSTRAGQSPPTTNTMDFNHGQGVRR